MKEANYKKNRGRKKGKRHGRRVRKISSNGEDCTSDIEQPTNKVEKHMREYINQKTCEYCQRKDHEESLLLCDRCDDCFHMHCLNPPLDDAPLETWICPPCEEQLRLLKHPKNPLSKLNTIRNCQKCTDSLTHVELLQGKNQKQQVVQIQIPELQLITCLFCKAIFHHKCFSKRKNSLNCWDCQLSIRKNGPKNHDEFLEYIEKQSEIVLQANLMTLDDCGPQPFGERHRHFNLKVPRPMTNWQIVTKHEASVYYALTTKNITFVDQQVYLIKEDEQDYMRLNNPDNEKGIYQLDAKDEKIFEEFKKNSITGYVGPFEIKEDRIKGFYLITTDFIEKMTIVSEYVGEVTSSRNALNEETNDSIFMLIRTPRSSESLDIVPTRYGNISRFFSGVNNAEKKKGDNWENIKVLRFNYQGRVRLLFYAKRQIQAGQTLYFDYNGNHAFHQYPTEHFTK